PMDNDDISYFYSILQVVSAYRISDFDCEATEHSLSITHLSFKSGCGLNGSLITVKALWNIMFAQVLSRQPGVHVLMDGYSCKKSTAIDFDRI
ncbi:hypothetical protein Tco_0957470, partial [Tanacetum coccineum]